MLFFSNLYKHIVKMKINKLLLYFAVAASALSSCATEGYEDLKAPIDKEMNVLGTLEFPIGKSAPISIGDFLAISETGIIDTDDAGNYIFRVDAPPAASSYSLRKITIGSDSKFTGSFRHESNHIAINPEKVPEIEEIIPTISVPFSFEYSDIPDDFRNVSSLDVNTAIDFSLSYKAEGIDAMTIKKGAQISIPDSYVISEISSNDFDQIEGTNNLVANKDIRIESGQQIDLKVRISQIIFDGPIDGTVYSNYFSLGGNVVLKAEDVKGSFLPDFEIVLGAKLAEMSVLTVTGEITPPALNMGSVSRDITDIPDIFKDAVLDIHGTGLILEPCNDLPCALKASFSIGSVNQKGESFSVRIEDIMVNPGDSQELYISEDGLMAPEGVRLVNVPGFDRLFHSIPSKVSVYDIILESVIDGPVKITAGKDYKCGFVSGRATIPLTFGNEMKLDYEQNIEFNLENIPDGLNTLDLSTMITSTLPFDMSISAKALDANGTSIDSITSDINGIIFGGALSAPKTSPVEISFNLGNTNPSDIKTIRFLLHAEMEKDSKPTSLNEGHYIQFNQITARIRDGFSLNLDK